MGDKTRLWYPHYVRDFKAKTAHLTLAEKGAYRALMDEYWERQGPLPADERTLCRLIGCFPDEWAEVRENVLPFFEEREGNLFHKRIDEEIARAVEAYQAKRDRIAKARAAKAAKDKPDDSPVDRAVDSPDLQTPSPAPSHILTDTEEPSGSSARARPQT